jgi:hypothetical protein
MTSRKDEKAPVADVRGNDRSPKDEGSASNDAGASAAQSSMWRERFRVHPAADVFPMMLGKERDDLVEDIKSHRLREPIEVRRLARGGPGGLLQDEIEVLDGRNRLQAMELAGIALCKNDISYIDPPDPVAYIISKNIHRRHLTKQQQVELIVTARMAGGIPKPCNDCAVSEDEGAELKPRNDCEVSKGGRGKVDKVKAAVVADAKALGIGKRTVELVMAKKQPKRKPDQSTRYTPRPKPQSGNRLVDAARRAYLDCCAYPDVDLAVEETTIVEALHKIASRRPATSTKRILN